MNELPYFNTLTLAIRLALYGPSHPVVQAMWVRNRNRRAA